MAGTTLYDPLGHCIQGKSQVFVLVFVGPCPVLCCFAVLLRGETQIWLGDLRVVFGCVFVLFGLFFVMICQSFWTTRVLYFTAFHRLRNCKDRA